MKYFKLREFVCNCGCHKNKIDRTFLKILNSARSYSKDDDGNVVVINFDTTTI